MKPEKLRAIVAHHTRSDSPFSEFEGKLWKGDRVVRSPYASHVRKINTTAHLFACLRAGQFAWPGGYEVFFYTTDGGVLSFEAVVSELRQVCEAIRTHDTRSEWCVFACECAANVDGPITCDHTGREIVSDPDAKTEDTK